ncbi:hypothetical protein ORI20_28060 [Mycobacterium sp. CVI_P3]|uniref:Lipoprotein n=1 Tax=Mycobacterium pinniadriaticum TaxID=2994102 RepID=A0ABT3SLZ6_9MYCO|nr:hypothetical protein [Mycobacterium pinniadriaticum]MCX2934128.1 hypothetical protein [Mycobacterium pinniadriaticum]MCX2940550.1 hypothetical protein [Mycobacterium pinniadriaticum]
MLSARMLVVGIAAAALTACGSTGVLPVKTSVSTSTQVDTVTAAPSTITRTRTVQPPAPPLRQSMRAWWNKVQDHVNAIQSAAHDVASAAQVYDDALLSAACSRYHDGVAGLQGHMPPPDPSLATELQAALSDYDVAMHFCVAATSDIDTNELHHSLEFLRSGNAAMQRAGAILQADLGEPIQIG